MLLPPADARRFIDTYQEVAVAIHALLERPVPNNPTKVVNEARSSIRNDPDLVQGAATHLRMKGETVDSEEIATLCELRLDEWVHLKDHKRGAILIDLKGKEAYRVTGLTQMLGSITGQTGAVIRTALCPFLGPILCDGVIGPVAALGLELRRSCMRPPGCSRSPATCMATRPGRPSGREMPCSEGRRTQPVGLQCDTGIPPRWQPEGSPQPLRHDNPR